ncbi:hypothetical protein BGZ82_003104 [Podila clonocystis]|nr:hypothetical protein BGZ82_003104 [Podila clonocystis]
MPTRNKKGHHRGKPTSHRTAPGSPWAIFKKGNQDGASATAGDPTGLLVIVDSVAKVSPKVAVALDDYMKRAKVDIMDHFDIQGHGRVEASFKMAKGMILKAAAGIDLYNRELLSTLSSSSGCSPASDMQCNFGLMEAATFSHKKNQAEDLSSRWDAQGRLIQDPQDKDMAKTEGYQVNK